MIRITIHVDSSCRAFDTVSIPTKPELPVKRTENLDIAWIPVCIDVMMFDIYRHLTRRFPYSRGNTNKADTCKPCRCRCRLTVVRPAVAPVSSDNCSTWMPTVSVVSHKVSSYAYANQADAASTRKSEHSGSRDTGVGASFHFWRVVRDSGR